MAGRRAQRPPSVPVAPNTNLTDPTVSRAVDEVRTAVQGVQSRREFDLQQVDLKVGLNAVQHNLGREPKSVNVTPTVADPAYAWALHTDNQHPERQILIDVVGIAQPGARVLLT